VNCPRCHRFELAIGHSCPDDSSPCNQCGRSRVVLVTLQDDRGTVSQTQPCLTCLPKTNGAK
jgi:hypothetical protein